MSPRRAAAAVASVLAVLATAGCADEGPREVLVEDGRAEVSVGDEVLFRVSSTPGMGDTYELRGPEDDAVLRYLGTEIEPSGDAPGSSQAETYRFEAIAPGDAEIVLFNCYRGCDEDGRPTEEPPGGAMRTATVTVTD
ncbi:protease inhibitor I42 family protein [Nitriliruptoraceae bacterium ZYF776]|nr:protease inhibitor I42 family protein [Profundirhabdus halotolerans]